jgi:hypothetical protein
MIIYIYFITNKNIQIKKYYDDIMEKIIVYKNTLDEIIEDYMFDKMIEDNTFYQMLEDDTFDDILLIPEYSTIEPETTVTGKRINELLKPEIATTNFNQTLNRVNQTQSMLANSPIINSESDESIQTRLEKSSEFSDVMMKSATSNFSEQMSSKIEEYTRTVDKMESSTITAPPIIMGNSGGASQAAPLSPSLSSFQSMGIIGTDEVPDPNYFGGSLELELMI